MLDSAVINLNTGSFGPLPQLVFERVTELREQLAAYHRQRGPRTARVIRESDEMGELYHIADAVTMRQAFVERDIARSRNEWLYPYDPWSAALD